MTLKEAYRIMRRFEDWRYGADKRDLYDVFPEDFKRGSAPAQRTWTQAFKMILASQGLDRPIADCSNCQHYREPACLKGTRCDNQNCRQCRLSICSKGVKGECTEWEARE